VRHLLVKDLQILRRSPGLLGLLVLYAVVLGVPVGYGLSAPPSKPRVAFLNEVSPTDTTVLVGAERLDVTQYADDLFAAIEPVEVGSRREAEEAVRSGEALAALIVPADVTRKLQDAVALTGSGEVPTLEVLYAAENPLKRRYVEQTIDARLAEANRALSRRITQVAARYIDILLRGGDFDILGRRVEALGLQRSARILAGVERTLPADDPRRAELARVREFADLAIENLDLSDEVLGAIGSPIKVRASTVAGSSASTLDSFAVAAATTIALMVVGVLLGAGMLALEREEHAFGRIVRGLVSRAALLAEKVLLGGICAWAVGVLLLVLLSLLTDVPYGRAPRWLAVLAVGALAFAALGVAIGAACRDVRAASLLAFLICLPVAALALVPSGAVGAGAYDAVRAVSALLPFRPALDGFDAALSGAGGVLPGLAHLLVLALAYGGLAWLALRRSSFR
jgi:ABC-2 type transport system permease protein